VASSRRHPTGHLGLLDCYTGHGIFSALSIAGSVIRRWIDAAFLVTALMRRFARSRGGVVFGRLPENAPLTPERLDPSPIFER
jgi:hypothetical protein